MTGKVLPYIVIGLVHSIWPMVAFMAATLTIAILRFRKRLD